MNVDDIAILNFIVLSVLTIKTSFLDSSFRSVLHELIISHDIAGDEALLEICVNGTSSLRGLRAALDGPATNLIMSSCEEVDELEGSVASTHDLGEGATSLEVDVLRLSSGLLGLLVASRDELGFEAGAEGDDRLGPWLAEVLDPLDDLGEPLVALALKVTSRHVDEVHDGLGAEKVEIVDSIDLIGLPLDKTDRTATLDGIESLVENFELLGGSLVLLVLEDTLKLLHPVADGLLILDEKLFVDNAKITHRIDGILDVGHLSILEHTDDLKDGISGTNVRKEGIAKTLTVAGTTHKTSNVCHTQVRLNLAQRLVHLAELIKTLIRNSNTSFVRLNGAEGEVGSRDGKLCKKVEKSRLSYIRKTNNTDLQVRRRTAKRNTFRHFCSFRLRRHDLLRGRKKERYR